MLQDEENKIQSFLLNKKEKMREKRAERLYSSDSFGFIEGVSKFMDDYFIDPIIGLLPGVGDWLSSVLVFPFIYVSLFKIRSIPLTLAIIYNVLLDVLLGCIPFFVGDVVDFFHKGYKKNLRLIEGFIQEDKDVIHDVNSKAVWMGIAIGIVCYLIYLCVKWSIVLVHWITNLF